MHFSQYNSEAAHIAVVGVTASDSGVRISTFSSHDLREVIRNILKVPKQMEQMYVEIDFRQVSLISNSPSG
jgi:hypothetical protein